MAPSSMPGGPFFNLTSGSGYSDSHSYSASRSKPRVYPPMTSHGIVALVFATSAKPPCLRDHNLRRAALPQRVYLVARTYEWAHAGAPLSMGLPSMPLFNLTSDSRYFGSRSYSDSRSQTRVYRSMPSHGNLAGVVFVTTQLLTIVALVIAGIIIAGDSAPDFRHGLNLVLLHAHLHLRIRFHQVGPDYMLNRA
ncbi:hypothetical protein DFH09DRAFT_1432610 [Mycena vulgaris]|nr:hypothetical protein DFH09DRAFT_1432610 [Mycena vulgaris]